MKVRDLVEMLSEMDEDLEVRFAYQPNYPLQSDLQQSLALRSGRDGKKRVYLLDGGQVYDDPYGPAGIFQGQLEDEEDDDLACESCGDPADGEMAEVVRHGTHMIVHATCVAAGEGVA